MADEPYGAFKLFIDICPQLAIPAKVMTTTLIHGKVSATEDIVWQEHPEGDPYREPPEEKSLEEEMMG